jgi:uncharacterized protein (TIGR02246 family)
MRDQFDRLVAAYMGAVEAGDSEAVARLYTEDALLLIPENPPISGRQAIQENYKESLGDGYKLIVKIQDFQEQGDTAYAAGTYEAEDENGSWLEVLQRQSDDSVLLHRVCWN